MREPRACDMWEALGYVEVALRNTIDRQLTARHARLERPGHWIFDEAHELGRDAVTDRRHKRPYLDIAVAIARVRGSGTPIVAEQVISELSFGFWHQMVSKSQVHLWPELVAAFPYAPNRSQSTVHDPVARLRALRNRIGHHHGVWPMNLEQKFVDMRLVTGYIDPRLAGLLADRCEVGSWLKVRPRPAG